MLNVAAYARRAPFSNRESLVARHNASQLYVSSQHRGIVTSRAPQRIAVLGAGITGLVTTYRLSRLLPNTKITLLESSSRIGGWMNSNRHSVGFKSTDGQVIEGDVILESGPRSLRPRGSRGSAATLKLIRDLGLDPSLIPISTSHPAARNRFLLSTDTSTLTALPSSIASLFSRQPPLLRSILPSLLSEPFQSKPPNEIRDESVDSFVRRRLGSKIADNLVSGMIHGIYATDSRVLSVRSGMGVLWDAEENWGSILSGMILGVKSKKQKEIEKREWAELDELGKERERWSLYGMKGGLGTFASKLREEVGNSINVEIRLNEPVISIQPSNPTSGNDSITITTNTITSQYDKIISALSPHNLSKILPQSMSLPHLTYNPSTSVGVISFVYPLPPSSIHPNGFGYLIPRSGASHNQEGILGVVFDSTAVPGLDDDQLEGKITKLTVMMGGPYWSSSDPYPTRERPENPEELLEPALNHLHRVFPVLSKIKPLLAIPRLHLDCIPTYMPYHGQRLREIHESIKHGSLNGSLSLVGNGYGGVGVNDCIYSAEEVVDGIVAGGDPTGLERWADWQ